jgi:hypothetical protein
MLSAYPTFAYNPSVYKAAETGWRWDGLDVVRQTGDFNGDGYQDVAVLYVYPDNKTFNLWVFPGSSSGLQSPEFQRQFSASDFWNYSANKFVAGDFNGDGVDDLVSFMNNPYGGVTMITINGSKGSMLSAYPTFAYNPSVYKAAETGWRWDGLDVVRQTGDFNGDGYQDVAVLYVYPDNKTFNLWVFPGSSSGLQSPEFQRQFSASDFWNYSANKFVAGDFNGDGVDDLVSFMNNPYGGVTMITINGSKGSMLSAYPTFAYNPSVYKAAETGWRWDGLDVVRQTGDFNGDGYQDVAVLYVYPDNKTFNLWVFPGSSSGLQSPEFQRQFSASDFWNYSANKFVAGDFNGDGVDDLVSFMNNPYGGVTMITINGSKGSMLSAYPTFAYNPSVYIATFTGWYWVYIN